MNCILVRQPFFAEEGRRASEVWLRELSRLHSGTFFPNWSSPSTGSGVLAFSVGVSAAVVM